MHRCSFYCWVVTPFILYLHSIQHDYTDNLNQNYQEFIDKNKQILQSQQTFKSYNHHGAEISVIWLAERSAIKLLILIRY